MEEASEVPEVVGGGGWSRGLLCHFVGGGVGRCDDGEEREK